MKTLLPCLLLAACLLSAACTRVKRAEAPDKITDPGLLATARQDAGWFLREDPHQVGESLMWYRPGEPLAEWRRVNTPLTLDALGLQDYRHPVWFRNQLPLPINEPERSELVIPVSGTFWQVWANGTPIASGNGNGVARVQPAQLQHRGALLDLTVRVIPENDDSGIPRSVEFGSASKFATSGS